MTFHPTKKKGYHYTTMSSVIMARLFITYEELRGIMVKALDSFVIDVVRIHSSVNCVVHILAQYELSSDV